MCYFSCWFVDLAFICSLRAVSIDGVQIERYANTTQAQEQLSMPFAYLSHSSLSRILRYSITTSWSSRRSCIEWDMRFTAV